MKDTATRSEFAASMPRPAAFIVYINGVQVPAKSVSLRYGVWQIPEMSLEMVADPVLLRFGYEDRVQVAVFYLDDTDVSRDVKPEFRMFGEGEITAWGYRNTPGGRSIVFTVINQIAVFTQLFVHFLTTLDDMVGHDTQPGKNVNSWSTHSSNLVYPYSLFTQGLIPGGGEGQPAELIRRPYDFLYNVMRGMIGKTVPDPKRSVPAANFFSRWARLTNFHNRFVASPFFDEVIDNDNIFPVLRALQNVSAVDIISNNLLPQIQNEGSIWDMLQMIYTTVLMEVAMIPSMPLVTVDLASSLIQPTDFSTHTLRTLALTSRAVLESQFSVDASAPTLAEISGRWVPTIPTESRKLKPKRIPNYFVKPQTLFGVPPSCNVIFPSQLLTYAYEENYATQPTRLYFNDSTLIDILKTKDAGLAQTIQNALAVGYPAEVDTAQRNQEKFANLNSKNFLIYPEEFFKGPVMDRRAVPPWMFFLAQSSNVKLPEQPVGSAVTQDGNVQPGTAPSQPTALPGLPGPTTPANVMATTQPVGVAGAGGARAYTRSVEELRAKAESTQANTGIPVDLQLAWISAETDGKLNKVTFDNKRGFFQIQGPHLVNGVAIPLPNTEAGLLGLALTDCGSAGIVDSDDKYPEARLTIDPDFSYDQGIRLIQIYRKVVNAVAKTTEIPFAPSPFSGPQTWSEGDMWRLTKLYHVKPALAKGPTSAIRLATAALGRPPNSWAEMYEAIAPSLSAELLDALNLATAVGGVVAGASGKMTTKNEPSPVSAPRATPAPLTPGTATTPGAAAAAPTSPDPNSPTYKAALESSETVYQLYAKYEYFRERYAKRSGSATIAWNPYVVPGFPCVIFDQRATRVDIFAYVTTVQQTMSHSGQRGTTLSFLYGRQFQEMFDLLVTEFARSDATARGSAPQEPLREVSKVIQSFPQAEAYYQNLFYGAQRLYGKDASFDFRNIIGYGSSEPGGFVEEIFLDGPDVESQDVTVAAVGTLTSITKLRENVSKAILDLNERIRLKQGEITNIVYGVNRAVGIVRGDVFDNTADATRILSLEQEISQLQVQLKAAQAQALSLDTRINSALSDIQTAQNEEGTARRVSHNLDGTRELVPLPSAQQYFDSRDAAMRYNWRPICTLDEYIIFYNSYGEGVVPASNHPQSAGARYFERIRAIIPPSPDFQPPTGAGGNANQGETVPGLTDFNFPQTRANWDEALIAYKTNVLKVKAPRT